MNNPSKAIYWQCQKGVAALEFAVIFPFLLLVLLGSVVGFDIYQRDRSVTHAANTVVDLMSRFDKINKTDRDILLEIPSVLTKSDNSEVQTRITNIRFRGGRYNVLWSRAKHWTPLKTGDLSAIDIPKIPEFDTILLAEVKVKYTPPLTMDAFSPIDLTYLSYRRPLLVDHVALND